MINTDWATICGTYCGRCEDLEACGGCQTSRGRRYCAVREARLLPGRRNGECDRYRCCLERKLEHCGLCDEFPCARFDWNSVGLPEELFQRNREWSIASLRRRAAVGTALWLREVSLAEGSD